MKENNTGKREAQKPAKNNPVSRYLAWRRDWIAGMTRGQRIRHRLLQAAVVVSVLIIAVWAALSIWLRPPEIPQPDLITPGSPSGSSSADVSAVIDSDDPFADWDTENPHISQSGRKEGIYTFLVAGKDVVGGGTDTMLLLSYDTNAKTIKGLNLPRDTMVNTSVHNNPRLNAVYTLNRGKDKATQTEKGMAALKKHVSMLTGITPDFYVVVEWEAVGRLVDAIGGVEFDVPFNMNYDDPYQNLHIHQSAGLRKLDGDDAMQVIRWRKNSDGSNSSGGDLARLGIQQDFLKAVIKKCLTPAIFLKIPDLVDIFKENVETDLTVGNILAFARLAYGMDPSSAVSFQTAPTASAFMYWNGSSNLSLITLSASGILEIVNGGMNPYLRDVTRSDLQVIYRNKDGSFGVTSGALANSRLAAPGAASRPKTETSTTTPSGGEEGDIVTDPGTGESTAPGTTPGTETPGTTAPGTETPGTTTPGTETPGTDTETPGTTAPEATTPETTIPGVDIDPSTVLPDPGQTTPQVPEMEDVPVLP